MVKPEPSEVHFSGSVQPPGAVLTDRRSSDRAGMRVAATFELGDRTYSGEIHNLNCEGAFLRCGTIASPFVLLTNLQFQLPNGAAVQVAEALVIWNNTDPEASLYPEGMGLVFQTIEPGQVEQIRAFIHQTAAY